MSRPRHALRCWEDIAARLRNAHLVLLTDFDGTITPIRRRAEDVVLAPKMRRRLAAIARAGATVGIVSGRGMDDLRKRTRLRGVWYAGAHGYILREPQGRVHSLADKTDEARICAIAGELKEAARTARKLHIEEKGVSVALHYRGAPANEEELARRTVREIHKRHPGTRVLGGKKIWEFLPNRGTDKWTAITAILKRDAKMHPGKRAAVFLGDDITDESVFKKLRGVSIAVGKRRGTAALFWLNSPSEAGEFLEKLYSAVAERRR